MPRIVFIKGYQRKFLYEVKEISNLSWPELANRCDVHIRTFSDWRREKYTISEKAFRGLIKIAKNKSHIYKIRVLPDFWNAERAARKAGLLVAKKYGGPGTPEGRRKGGLISQFRRRLSPEKYGHCNIRKEIFRPPDSEELAEFFGILLGDGGIATNYQVVITLNKENDKDYIIFVSDLIKKLFKISPAIYNYNSEKSKNVVGVVVSGANLVEFLLSKGLKRGNKTKQQVGVPGWIINNVEFSKGCLRGLIDTDGGIYYHRHKSHGYKHFNIGLIFTNKSLPLLSFVRNNFLIFGFTPKFSSRNADVHLYREAEVLRYCHEIKFHNSYHSERIKNFAEIKQGKGA